MTILVTGSRIWPDRKRIILRLMEEPDGTTIIEGGSYGADEVARFAARALGFNVMTVQAEWKTYGRRAGPMRNRRMLDMKPDKVLAFCKDNSAGTMDCVRAAIERKIPVELIED